MFFLKRTFPPVVWEDSFARANGLLGSNWVYGPASSSTPAIISDVCAMSGTSAGFYPVQYVSPVGIDSQFVQVTLAGAVTSSGTSFFLRAKSDWSQYMLFGVDTSGSYLQLVTSGPTYTTEATSSTSIPSGATLKLTAVGYVFTGYVNGTQFIQWTDSSHTTSIGSSYRMGGVSAYYTGSTAAQGVQNFVFGDLI